MKNLRKLAVIMMLFASIFMTGCDASKVMKGILTLVGTITLVIPVVKVLSSIFSSKKSNTTAVATDSAIIDETYYGDTEIASYTDGIATESAIIGETYYGDTGLATDTAGIATDTAGLATDTAGIATDTAALEDAELLRLTEMVNNVSSLEEALEATKALKEAVINAAGDKEDL